MLKKGNTKQSSPPAGAKGNAHELAINFHELFFLSLQILTHGLYHILAAELVLATFNITFKDCAVGAEEDEMRDASAVYTIASSSCPLRIENLARQPVPP